VNEIISKLVFFHSYFDKWPLMKDYRMSVFNISLIILYLLLYAFVECGICVRMWFCDFILPCVEVGSLLAENQQQASLFFLCEAPPPNFAMTTKL
jgi:hypothetical protein